jgi:Tol biopolymer transport system component
MDLWLISVDGKSAWPLTSLPDNASGVLHPHFSADGRKIAWSQMRQKSHFLTKGQEYGFWTIYVADFALKEHAPLSAIFIF